MGTRLSSFHGRTAALLGLGRSNLPLLSLLYEAGARITVRDRRPEDALGIPTAVWRGRGVRFRTGEGYLDGLSEELLFRSPGLRPDLGAIRAALARGARLLGEYELFASLTPATLLAVTGSDGKTTTTTLAGRMLEEATAAEGRRVFVGGNIGTPLISSLFAMRTGDLAVAELSSFQLITGPRPPERAAITNVTPNHLNWHRDMREYVAAKRKILGPSTHPVLNADNPVTVTMADAPVDKTLFSTRLGYDEMRRRFDNCHLICADKGDILVDGAPILAVRDLLLPGRHNLENCMAAIGLVLPWIGDGAGVRRVARSFGGVAHRLEMIGSFSGVRYYNSSIDSTPSRTRAALSAIGGRPILLCGGRNKGLSFDPLAEAVRDRVRALILFGESREEIAAAMRRAGQPFFLKERMEEAVRLACEIARPGDTVLLSPACTSFDEFLDFEERGNSFCRLVRTYAGHDPGND